MGVIHGGTVCNTVPDTCTLEIDTRYWRDEDGHAIDAGLEALAHEDWGEGITVEARRISRSPAMPHTEASRELAEIVTRAAGRMPTALPRRVRPFWTAWRPRARAFTPSASTS